MVGGALPPTLPTYSRFGDDQDDRGTHKFSYDMWGDTANTASRMESSGLSAEIKVSAVSHELLSGGGYVLEPRGTIDVTGKGHMDSWLLVGKQ